MRFRDRGEPPIEGGGLHRMGVVGQEQPDRMRIGGKGEEPARVAPRGEQGPVRLVGVARRIGVGAERPRLVGEVRETVWRGDHATRGGDEDGSTGLAGPAAPLLASGVKRRDAAAQGGLVLTLVPDTRRTA